MCSRAHGDRRAGASMRISLDFVKGFQLVIKRATCFHGKSTG